MVFASSLAFPDLVLISTTRVNIGCSLIGYRVKGTFAAGRGDGLVFVCTKHATPLRLMGQLPGMVAETRLAQVGNAAVFRAHRITNFWVVVLPFNSRATTSTSARPFGRLGSRRRGAFHEVCLSFRRGSGELGRYLSWE